MLSPFCLGRQEAGRGASTWEGRLQDGERSRQADANKPCGMRGAKCRLWLQETVLERRHCHRAPCSRLGATPRRGNAVHRGRRAGGGAGAGSGSARQALLQSRQMSRGKRFCSYIRKSFVVYLFDPRTVQRRVWQGVVVAWSLLRQRGSRAPGVMSMAWSGTVSGVGLERVDSEESGKGLECRGR